MTDEQRQRVSEELAIAWLRDMAHDDETDPDEPTNDGHARCALDAIERRDVEIARLKERAEGLLTLLRAHRVAPVRVQHGQAHCRYCLEYWRPCDDEPERHKPGCLAAPSIDAAEKP